MQQAQIKDSKSSSRVDELAWRMVAAMPADVPRELLEQKTSWDVDALIKQSDNWAPGAIIGILFLDGDVPAAYTIIMASWLYRSIRVDTLVMDKKYRSPFAFRRVAGAIHIIASTWAKKVGFNSITWETDKPKGMQRMLRDIGRVTVLETTLRMEVGDGA